MAWLEYLGLALLLFALVCVALLSLRIRDVLLIWAWGWIALLLTAVLFGAFDAAPFRIVAAVLAEAHPLLMLVGALVFLGRAVPRWLVPIALAAAAVRASFEAAEMGTLGHAVVWPLEFAALMAAGALLWQPRQGDATPLMQRIAAAGLVGIALVETIDVGLDLIAGPSIWWEPWIVVGVITAGAQLVLYLETQSRRTVRSEANLIESDRLAQEARERFDALAELAHDVIAEIADDGIIRYASPNAKRVLGLAPEEVVGHTLIEIAEKAGAEPGGPSPFPDLSFSLSELQKQAPYNRLVRMRTGGEARWLEIEAHTFTSPGGQTRAIAMARDVTARMDFQHQLLSVQKLESLGVLAGGVAHDFNNLLMGVLGNAELARADLKKGASAALDRHLDGIVNAAHLAAGLTAQLLTYAGKGPRVAEPVSIIELIRQADDLLRTAADSRASIELQLDHNTPGVIGDRAQLTQIMLNLVSNAAEASAGINQKIIIRCGGLHTTSAPPSDLGRRLAPGEYAFIEVTDTGAGMTAELKSRIFDPFFTTKLTGRGLGLAAVQGMVLAHGGGMTVTTAPGEGSTFRVLLPATNQATVDVAARAESNWRGAGLVLLVDDTPIALEAVRAILTQHGLDVMTADCGAHAREIISARADGLALAVLDFALPDDSAADLIELIEQKRPGLPVVVISGYSREDVDAALKGLRYAKFLQKPFGAQALVDAIEALTTART